MTQRPRRSALFLPASNPRAIEKARNLSADVVILDLEDAVIPDSKPAARVAAIQAASDGGWGPRELVIRVNALTSPWGKADVAAASLAQINAILLPKVEDPETVITAARYLDEAGTPASLRLWAMIETASGVNLANRIAVAHSRLAALVVGTADLGVDLRVPETVERTGLLTALSLCVLAARAAGLVVLDGVYPSIHDNDGLSQQCNQGVALGFNGKTLIHPSQISTANQIFSPSPESLAKARAIISAHDQALSQGQAVAIFDSRMIEGLHAENARRLLALAALISDSQT